MVTIGNDTLPGTITTLESAASAGTGVGAPGTPVILGQGYLHGSNASGSADTAYRITRPNQASTQFGNAENSQLTTAVQDALAEGAYPVYAIAPSEVEVTGEDLSGVTGQSTTLANAPILENPGDITFTINSTQKTTVLYHEGDPSNATPGTDEVLLNPVTGKAYADESMGNTGDSVDYWHADYTNTFDEITNHEVGDNTFLRDVVDFLQLIPETDSVVSDLKSKVISMETNGHYAIAIAGAGDPYIDDAGTEGTDETSSFSHAHDTSRLQLINPSRKGDGTTLAGSYVGARARIGIDSTPIFKSLRTATGLLTNLSTAQQENLVLENVIPIEERSGSARIIEDMTTVSDSNSEEAAWQQGISRLVTDFVTEIVEEESNNYVGEFNDRSVLNNIRGNISSRLKPLLGTGQLEAYSLIVEEKSSTVAVVNVGIDTADPLRNIELTVSAGDVSNGVSVEGN